MDYIGIYICLPRTRQEVAIPDKEMEREGTRGEKEREGAIERDR